MRTPFSLSSPRHLLRCVAQSRLGWIARHGVRDRGAFVPRSVAGFTSDTELIALRRIVLGLPPNAQVVEIGSWLGRSSVVIARALRGTKARLYCIDTFGGVEVATSPYARREYARTLGEADQRATFERNVVRQRLAARIETLAGYAHECAQTWSTPLDAVFFDGDHRYEAVRQDILDWAPHVRPGGYLIFHDYFPKPPHDDAEAYFPGPARAVRELLHASPLWEMGEVSETLLTMRRSMVGTLPGDREVIGD